MLEGADPGSLRFRYPTVRRGQIGYVKPDVIIEFGHADTWPAQDIEIRPYVADALEVVKGTVKVHVLGSATHLLGKGYDSA